MAELSTIKKNSKLKIKVKETSQTNKITNFWIPFSIMLPAVILFTLFTIIPLFNVVKDASLLDANNAGGFEKVWGDSDWYLSVRNSLIYASISLPISLALSLVISGAITSLVRKKARGSWQTIFFLPYVTSAIAVSLTFTHILSQQGLVNQLLGIDYKWLTTFITSSFWGSLPAVILFGVWHSLAFQILIFSTAMMAIDKRLYYAANIDGAKSTRVFFTVTLPSIEKTFWYVFTLGLIGAVKVFPLALFHNDSAEALDMAPTMLIYIYDLVGKMNTNNKGQIAAASISMILIIIVYNILVRQGVNLTRWGISKSRDVARQNRINKEIQKGKIIEYHRKFNGGDE